MAISKEQLWESELRKWLEKKPLREREKEVLSDETHPIVVSDQPIAQVKFLLNENFDFKMVSQNLADAMKRGDILDSFHSMNGLKKLKAKRFKYPELISTITKQFDLVSQQGWKSSETRLDMTTVDLPLRHPLNGVFHSYMTPLKVYARKHYAEGWCGKFCSPEEDWRHSQSKAIEALEFYDEEMRSQKEFWKSREGWVVWMLTSVSCFHCSAHVQRQIIDSVPLYMSKNAHVK
tara:strand:+ start:1502 stop:2203 length:702 start_codon:yes stop_codon:yes gene_type:complete